MREKNKKRIKNIVYIAMFAALIAVCSLISVPFTVPFTLQTFAVFLSLYVLGGKRGTLALLAYICLGLAGMPVFSGFIGGFSAFLGSSGGYLVGFVVAALIYLAGERFFGGSTAVCVISSALGLAACYVCGSAWFALVYAGGTGAQGFAALMLQCVLPFVVPDIIKISLALFLKERLRKHAK